MTGCLGNVTTACWFLPHRNILFVVVRFLWSQHGFRKWTEKIAPSARESVWVGQDNIGVDNTQLGAGSDVSVYRTSYDRRNMAAKVLHPYWSLLEITDNKRSLSALEKKAYAHINPAIPPLVHLSVWDRCPIPHSNILFVVVRFLWSQHGFRKWTEKIAPSARESVWVGQDNIGVDNTQLGAGSDVSVYRTSYDRRNMAAKVLHPYWSLLEITDNKRSLSALEKKAYAHINPAIPPLVQLSVWDRCPIPHSNILFVVVRFLWSQHGFRKWTEKIAPSTRESVWVGQDNIGVDNTQLGAGSDVSVYRTSYDRRNMAAKVLHPYWSLLEITDNKRSLSALEKKAYAHINPAIPPLVHLSVWDRCPINILACWWSWWRRVQPSEVAEDSSSHALSSQVKKQCKTSSVKEVWWLLFVALHTAHEPGGRSEDIARYGPSPVWRKEALRLGLWKRSLKNYLRHAQGWQCSVLLVVPPPPVLVVPPPPVWSYPSPCTSDLDHSSSAPQTLRDIKFSFCGELPL